MSAALVDQHSHQPHVRPLSGGLPPSETWARPRPDRTAQPTLQILATPNTDPGPPRPNGHRVRVVTGPGATRQAAGLPDAAGWSSSLALAMAEALQGRRSVGQLSRWVDEQVLATLTVQARRLRSRSPGSRARPTTSAGGLPPTVLRSVHLQFPQGEAAEVAAHLQAGVRSMALAFRLEARCGRWLCTALELGPRSQLL